MPILGEEVGWVAARREFNWMHLLHYRHCGLTPANWVIIFEVRMLNFCHRNTALPFRKGLQKIKWNTQRDIEFGFTFSTHFRISTPWISSRFRKFRYELNDRIEFHSNTNGIPVDTVAVFILASKAWSKISIRIKRGVWWWWFNADNGIVVII